jgi:hypothetical protein
LLPSGSRIFLSFWSCCIFCYTISSYLSTVWSSFSWASSSQLLPSWEPQVLLFVLDLWYV